MLSVGHSSTSISAGIGIAVAAEKENKQRRTVCVIGDGAITAGMAFEAMNHAGDIKPDMLVILNDNEMSISENVGALNNHLAQLLSGKLYSSLREGGKKSSPAYRRSKSCLSVPKNTSKAWSYRVRCSKSWALIISARWTATMCWAGDDA